MTAIVYVGGRFVPEKDAKVPVFDRSYLYGEGVFETLRVYGGKSAFVNLHYHRLQHCCAKLAIELPLDEYGFERMLQQLILKNRQKEAVIRITVSAVGAAFGMDRPARMPTLVTAFCRAFKGKPPEWYAQGAPVVVAKTVVADQPLISNIKSTNYLVKMMARAEAAKAGAADALLTDGHGHYMEGSATNLFLVKKGVLITPAIPEGVLPGVTRSVILGVADTLDIPWDESPMTEKMVKDADEIFLTGSTSEVLPVREVNGVCKKKAPGPITRDLWNGYCNLLKI